MLNRLDGSFRLGRLWSQGGALVAATTLLLGCGSSTSTSTIVKGQVVVQVTSPASGTVINANSVTVRGTVSPPAASVQVDGQPAAVGNGVFTGNASLQVGKTTIDIIASAPGQTPGSTMITLTRPGASSGKPSSSGQSNAPASNGGATPGTAYAAPGSQSGGQSPCGNGLSVGPGTSCAFAGNVRSSYQGPGTFSVSSPVTGQSYSMTCNENSGQVVCTGGNNASVYFPG